MSNNPPKWEPEEPSDPLNITGKYILKHRKPVECADITKWGRWLQKGHNKRVRVSYIGGHRISTVFLGLNHDFRIKRDARTPVLFETMIFLSNELESLGGIYNQEYTRCCAWREALSMHWDMVKRAKYEIHIKS